MQGKFVFSQSPSTFLFLYRFSMKALVILGRAERQRLSALRLAMKCVMKNTGSTVRLRRSPLLSLRYSLLAQSEIRLAPAGHSHRIGLVLGAFMPRRYGVASIGNVFDLVVAAVVRFGKIRSRADHDISRHVWMDIAEYRDDSGLIEGKGALFTLRPRAEIVSCFL